MPILAHSDFGAVRVLGLRSATLVGAKLHLATDIIGLSPMENSQL